MSKIKSFFKNLINWLLVFMKKIWIKLNSKFKEDKKTIVKTGDNISKKIFYVKNKKNLFENKNIIFDKVIQVKRYNYNYIINHKNRVVYSTNFKARTTELDKLVKNSGEVKILNSRDLFNNKKNVLKLSLPENSINSLAMVEKKIKLKKNTCYNLLITVRTNKTTTFPLIYLVIDDKIYKLYCNNNYKSFKITFKNNDNKSSKIKINTGYKTGKSPTDFYIDNIIIYEIPIFTTEI